MILSVRVKGWRLATTLFLVVPTAMGRQGGIFDGILRPSSSSKPSTSSQPMRVIGAGLGRTATSSLREALSQLGYRAYHMKEGAFETPGHMKLWCELAKARGTPQYRELAHKVIRAMADDGFNATTDYPACLLYEELMAAYPDAKVILSVRSSGEAWAKSVLSTIGLVGPVLHRLPFSLSETNRCFVAHVNAFLFEEVGAAKKLEPGMVPDAAELARAHDSWITRVKATVPPEKLLIHEAKEGYAPICSHLGLVGGACTSQYPNINDSSDFVKQLSRLSLIADAFIPGLTACLLVVVLLGGYCLRRLRKKDVVTSTTSARPGTKQD